MGQMANLVPETFFETTLTDEQRRPVRICSVYPQKVVITHGASSVCVPECREGQRVAYSDPVGAGHERRDYGNDQLVVLESISARDNALDAIGLTRGRVNSRGQSIQERTTSDWYECGFFVPEGQEPTDAEITAARSRLDEWARRWVNKGDESFAVDQKPARVDFRAKLAARILRVKRAWSEGMIADSTVTIPCPSCRLPIVSGATKCPSCGDRFQYVDGRPVLAGTTVPELAMPTTPPPGKAQGRI